MGKDLFKIEKIFSISEQYSFSSISGDYNPLHIDKKFSRRSLFGEPVVHGINSLMWCLDSLMKQYPDKGIKKIETWFLQPILLDKPIIASFALDSSKNIRVTITSEAEVLAIFEISLCNKISLVSKSSIPKIPPPKLPCEEINLTKLNYNKKKLNIFYPEENIITLYPNLLNPDLSGVFAVIISASKLVGMECPGLNSLFTRFSIDFVDIPHEDHYHYKIDNFNKRFGLFRLKLLSNSFSGSIEAFVRPKTFPSTNFSEVKKLVSPNEFKEKFSLIIGGSRGLGETTSKIISAGGGRTFLTYHQGEDDVKKVVEQIRKHGHKSDFYKFDINNQEINLPDEDITDIFYFASPRIRANNSSVFNYSLYQE